MQKRPVRRDQLISPWGVGAMINFPGDESLMVAGLDAWAEEYRRAEAPSEFTIAEERLASWLGVSELRLPPDYRSGAGERNRGLCIPMIRFPRWHYCPICGHMEMRPHLGGLASCIECDLPAARRPRLLPVRFVCACEKGHIEDFPFDKWVHQGNTCGDVHLRWHVSVATGTLSGIRVKCLSCGVERSMAGASNPGALASVGVRCSGARPWLGEVDERAAGCGAELTVAQRGAANVYFPVVRSSLYLPTWTSSTDHRIVACLDENWTALRASPADETNQALGFLARRSGLPVVELTAAYEERLRRETDGSVGHLPEEDYRRLEYNALLSGSGGTNQDFHAVVQSIEQYRGLEGLASCLVLVHKLRETRAFAGFTRLSPECGAPVVELRSQLALSRSLSWLPAVAVRGEGIFLQLDGSRLAEWAARPAVQERSKMLARNYNRARQRRRQPEEALNPRFVLIHTLAHLFINRLSYVCGYGSSSLRERLFVDRKTETPDEPMNGMLIYTASGDSEGSLGGLVRQGKPGLFEHILGTALDSAKWCSSDPICIDSKGQGPDNCNLAACHNCTLLPETCCEHGNRLLDRAMLVGTIEDSHVGFFDHLR